MRNSPKFVSLIALCTLIAAGATGTAHAGLVRNPVAVTSPVQAATAGPGWASAATAAIHPGVQTFTKGAQCTANFVFTDGSNVYIGQAAHCAGTGGSTATNGCTSGSQPLGTPVTVGGASSPGTLVYSSWLTMQSAHETDANACEGNDFALVQLAAGDIKNINPSVPFWGGPTSLDDSGTRLGESVYSYGNSELRAGVSALSPKYGVSLGDDLGGWIHNIYTATPGVPGDSGSAVLGSSGAAVGVLRTINTVPPAANGVGDLAHELEYMHSHGLFTAVHLVTNTADAPFTKLV